VLFYFNFNVELFFLQAVTFIFKSLGIKCVPYISQVMPSFLNVIRMADVNFKEFLFQQLGVLIAIVKQHIRNYLDDIFALIKVKITVTLRSTNEGLETCAFIFHCSFCMLTEFEVIFFFVWLQEFWTINSPLQTTLILSVEHIAVALGAEFKVYLPQLMPQILKVLNHDTSKDRTVTLKVNTVAHSRAVLAVQKVLSGSGRAGRLAL